MTRTYPNTDDYAQFVGRIAFETREAMAPHLAASMLEKLLKRERPVEFIEALNYYCGSRNHTARLLAPPHEMLPPRKGVNEGRDEWAMEFRTFRKLRPVFVHCVGCRLPVMPSGWRFTFAPMAMKPEKMNEACQSAQRWHKEGAM